MHNKIRNSSMRKQAFQYISATAQGSAHAGRPALTEKKKEKKKIKLT
jgi:hypothetical protein